MNFSPLTLDAFRPHLLQEGAVLELLQHEPEKQLEALGRVLSSRGGSGIDQHHHSRIVEVVQNLATVPSFFSLVNR